MSSTENSYARELCSSIVLHVTSLQVAIAAKKQSEMEGVRREEIPDLITSLTAEDTVVFVKGDKVKVTEGDLQGLWGHVQNVRDDGTVEMMPQLKELTEILPFPPSQLAKTFEVKPPPL